MCKGERKRIELVLKLTALRGKFFMVPLIEIVNNGLRNGVKELYLVLNVLGTIKIYTGIWPVAEI